MTNALKQKLFRKNRLILILTLFLALLLIDGLVEFFLGATREEMLVDIVLEMPRVFLLIIIFYLSFRELDFERKLKRRLQSSLKSSKGEVKYWQGKAQDYVRFFGEEIHKEFARWGLSKSEQEVAVLILRGKATKEIASLRFTSDRTIRNQCQSIYEKSGLSGRHELSAFFLDRFLPRLEESA